MRYRVAQFFHTFWTSLRSVDTVYAARHLPPDLLRLFERMAHTEQYHAIDVCRALEAQGRTDPDLLAAALLHDVGKIQAPPRIWDRVIAVLGEYFVPASAVRWSAGEPRGLHRGFVIRRIHPEWGAALAQQAGASPRTVALISQHHALPGENAELAALQAADEE